ncbi:MAG: T9SS type A sorting domain-containing protein [Crocinitomicaceae bacterium]|nr:T9SS type A sorting domain-containing protein [Crocinitomicaceae bacterium]
MHNQSKEYLKICLFQKWMFGIMLVTISFFSNAQYSGNGLRFDGANDYIQTGFPGIAGSNARTIECWFKGSFSSVQRFFVDMGATSGGNGSRFSFKINPSATVARIEIAGAGLNGVTNIVNNAWHHLAVTFDPLATINKYKIYVDGILDVQGDLAPVLNTSATAAIPLCIGIRADLNTTTVLNGSIDDVRIWNTARTASEIAANYTAEFCGPQPGLVAYFKLNDGAYWNASNTFVTSAKDVVNPLNTNLLYGFALTGTNSNFVSGIASAATIINPVAQTITGCSYTNSVGSIFYNSATISDTLQTTFGCDSVLSINFISTASFNLSTVTACSNYTWLNGQTYTTSGMYADTLTTLAGCDSIVVLNLTILSAAASTENITSCTPISWLDGNTYFSSNNSATYTFTNAAGCDSVVTLNLVINNPYTHFDTVISCDSYTWTNGMTYTVSGHYGDTSQTINGCDSLSYLELIIETPDVTVSQNTPGVLEVSEVGANYQWIDCATNLPISGQTSQSFTATQNGNYQVLVSTANCSDTSDCVVVSELSLNEHAWMTAWTIFPNPSSSTIEIQGIEQLISLFSISILDSKGTSVNQHSGMSKSIDVSHLENGIYFIQIATDKGMTTKRLMKN